MFITAVQGQLGLPFQMTHSDTYLQNSPFCILLPFFVGSLLELRGQADKKFNVTVKEATHHCHSSRSLFTEGPSMHHHATWREEKRIINI